VCCLLALAPLDFGRFSHDLIVGQFAGGGDTQSSGYIAAYDLATGKFEGLLQDASGKPLAINGIWAISPGNVSPGNDDASAAPAAQLYFTAGPRLLRTNGEQVENLSSRAPRSLPCCREPNITVWRRTLARGNEYSSMQCFPDRKD